MGGLVRTKRRWKKIKLSVHLPPRILGIGRGRAVRIWPHVAMTMRLGERVILEKGINM
jgi:hypothetical protein